MERRLLASRELLPLLEGWILVSQGPLAPLAASFWAMSANP
jgi:hypothetical protein